MSMDEVGRTKRGRLYRDTPVGVKGHRYWSYPERSSGALSDGVMIWDTSLTSIPELEAAIRIEREFRREVRDARTSIASFLRMGAQGTYDTPEDAADGLLKRLAHDGYRIEKEERNE